MKDLYKNYLFTKHVLVNDNPNASDPFPVLVALATKFGIRITGHPELADTSMIRTASENLGEYVPEPFYTGFPYTVRQMTSNQFLYDQLLHYTHTYGLGWFDRAGHSVAEQYILQPRAEAFEEVVYNEDVQPKEFKICTEEEATDILKESIRDLLSSNRPLNQEHLILAKAAFDDFKKDIIPDFMPCKSTVIYFVYELKSLYFCKFLSLPDVIKLLNYIQYNYYGSENLKKLNLRNKDRKLITEVIDRLFDHGLVDPKGYAECFEKRKIWCGLLHHIHYQAKTPNANAFVHDIRNGPNRSYYAQFEKYMRDGRTADAAMILKEKKGSGALLRNMNYILSRCGDDKEIEEVFSCLE